MAVINKLKDGTVVDDMSKVTVPKEMIQRLALIAKEKKKGEKEDGKNHNS